MLHLPVRADSINWDMVQKEAATGKAYLHKHKDVHGRPVIVIKSALHRTGKSQLALEPDARAASL